MKIASPGASGSVSSKEGTQISPRSEKTVVPAWIAGIQIRKDAFGDVHVDLDSSTLYWNDAIEGFCLNCPSDRIFKLSLISVHTVGPPALP